MGQPTLWGAGEMLRAFFSKAATPPPSFYLALITDVAPNAYLNGDELSEPDPATGYTRAELPNTTATFGDKDTGQLHMVYNIKDINYLTATADWGNVGYWAVCDSPVSGNVYFFGDFDTTNFIAAGDQVQVPAALLTIEFGPFFFDEEP